MEERNPVLEAIRMRRSIRRYTDEPLRKEVVLRILEAGQWAPSGLNNQAWRFLALRGDDPRADALSRCTKYTRIVKNATVLICLFLEKERMYDVKKDHQGAGACIQNMLLAAHSLGLGGVWLGEIINQSTQVMDIFGLDAEKLELQAVLAFGYPAEAGGADRLPLEKLLLEQLWQD
jgi:nitroreductase